jgi:hypothetical protein
VEKNNENQVKLTIVHFYAFGIENQKTYINTDIDTIKLDLEHLCSTNRIISISVYSAQLEFTESLDGKIDIDIDSDTYGKIEKSESLVKMIKSSIEKQSISNTELKHFWRSNGMDWIADLPEMEKAIVVTYYTPNFPSHDGHYYSISPRSFFPFTDNDNKTRFDNYYDCCVYAESIILNWIKALFIAE